MTIRTRWTEFFAAIRRRAEELEEAGQAMESLVVGEIQLDFPSQLQSITFGQSDRDERLQLADILAGSAAYLYAAASGARPVDDFARALKRSGVGDLITHEVGPKPNPAIIRQLG